MKDGYVRVEVVTPDIKVADCIFNTEQICSRIDKAYDAQVSVIVFPEMCITGYTCNDLFLQDTLLSDAQKSLATITEYTKGKNMLTVVGLPFEYCNKLYNVAAVIKDGVILGLVPKKYIPNYNEFYERRQFTEGFDKAVKVCVAGQQTYMGSRILFRCSDFEKLVVGVEICEDLWTPLPPSVSHAMNGATLIVNPSASNETVGKEDYRRSLVTGQSARLVCAYAYASSGDGESTQDIVFGGHDIIAENGTLLAETSLFANNSVINDIDFDRLNSERRRMSTFTSATDNDEYTVVDFSLAGTEYTSLVRFIDPHPFVPENEATRNKRCEAILSIQAMGLKKRLAHIGCKNVVIGISGGLDSTLALLVAVRAYGLLGLDMSGIHAVTMPGFGTTDRTYDNAVKMIKSLGCTFHEISIRESVTRHFEDIGHDINVHDVTYENGQARERTQILMDIANKVNGIVIGTVDMSELALGWATYNGDHMSMYGVNASVPKTLVRHLVKYAADDTEDEQLREVLYDVLDTPVSPELLPPKDGDIAQKTEDLVGPYELHDFFLYFMLRFGYEPAKIYRLACSTFEGEYDRETILKWLKTFCRRFFSQQFKRSCLPDGPKVGTVALSPRGDWRMPSDACVAVWMKELETL